MHSMDKRIKMVLRAKGKRFKYWIIILFILCDYLSFINFSVFMLWVSAVVFNRISMLALWDNYKNKTEEQVLLKTVEGSLSFLTTVFNDGF